MILREYVTLTGEVVCRSGLHIGGAGGGLEIGAVDNTMIREPLTGYPYIPGSSLKGKMRSGLEAGRQNLNSRQEPQDTLPCGCGRPDCIVCRLFGAHFNMRNSSGPTRLLVRDLLLTDESKERIRELALEGVNYVEEKTENIINRKTRAAEHPRTSERVPPTLSFSLKLVIRVFDSDRREELVGAVRQALELVEMEGLGGSISRGYGEVEIRNLQEAVRTVNGAGVASQG